MSNTEQQEQHEQKKQILEAAILASPEPLSAERLQQLFDGRSNVTIADIRSLTEEIQADCETRGIELCEVASGYRFQAKEAYTPWLQKLWERKPPRYSRALLETLALIVYRQPISRGEIEEIRGVVVGTNIIKTLMDRDWIKIVGSRDVPGKPALFGTTKKFLDYFNLKNLSDLPPLEDVVNLDEIEAKLNEQLKQAIAGNKGEANETEGSSEEAEASEETEETVTEEASEAIEASQEEQVSQEEMTDEVAVADAETAS